MLKYSHPAFAVLLHYWPSMILLPTILIVIAALALITRWWDEHDESGRQNVR